MNPQNNATLAQNKKKDTAAIVVVVLIVIGIFGLTIFAIYAVCNFVFGLFLDHVSAPGESAAIEYLVGKYGDDDKFSATGESAYSGCSYFETGICSEYYHSEKYNRDFAVTYVRGDKGSEGYFSDEYWLAEHGDGLDAYYKQLFSDIFDHEYNLQYISNSSELNRVKVDLSTEELLKDERFRIMINIMVTEEAAESSTLDFKAIESAMADLAADLTNVESVRYVVKSNNGRYPKICSVVAPNVRDSSLDYCSRRLLPSF